MKYMEAWSSKELLWFYLKIEGARIAVPPSKGHQGDILYLISGRI